MQTKTIKKVIKNKLNNWIASIDDEKVRNLAKENTIVTGGSIVSLLLKEQVNDFDIYFKNKETTKAVAEYYIKIINNKDSKAGLRVLDGEIDSLENEYKNNLEINTQVSIAIKNLDKERIKILIPNIGHYRLLDKKEDEKKETFDISFISANAITLTDDIQIVVRFHGDPKEIHKNYDFIHATNYYDLKNDELVTNTQALESILTKRLVYSGSLYPLTSVIRTKKFLKRGWNIGASEYLKMCFQISQLDLIDPVVLEEQLMGVDVAYFSVLIEALKNMTNKDPNFIPTFEWISSMLDKVFNDNDEIEELEK